MYLREAKITNIRSITQLTWRIPDDASLPGWHVIVGNNGSGKSSFLKSVAITLIGENDASALWTNFSDWPRRSTRCGQVELRLSPRFGTHSPGKNDAKYPRVQMEFYANAESGIGFQTEIHSLTPHPWNPDNEVFSVGYGPFRRFTGEDQRLKELAQTKARLGRHLSLLDESFALTQCLEWLRELQFKSLEKQPDAGGLLRHVTAFINQPDFLPFQAKIERITSDGIVFTDGNGAEVKVNQLSDGYRSVLSLTFDLIRQLAAVYGPLKVFDPSDPTKIIATGIVLIDEIDAHLHPTWQKQVGLWFREHFPNIQFIVTTHSPLVCQAADVGTVFRLPSPGSDEEGHFITGNDLRRLLDGNVLEAFGTGVFGEGITRSDRSRQHLKRLAELNVKEINAGLSEAEQHEQTELRSALPTTAHTLSMQP